MAAQVLKIVTPGGTPYDALLIATGISMQFALAYYLEWLSGIGWNGKPRSRPMPGRREPPSYAALPARG